jgi:glycyl-tRNA synthetase beta chain
LASGAVREFPELQGIMGGYYYAAKHEKSGIHTKIAAAIRDHYHPIGAQTDCPKDALSTAVSLVDKIDSLFWLLAAGEKPTGSRDPLGLRRLALAIVRLMVEAYPKGQPLISFPDAFYRAASTNEALLKQLGASREAIVEQATQILIERSDAYLRENYGFGLNVWYAAKPEPNTFSFLAFINAKILHDFLSTPEGKALCELRKRAVSIVSAEEAKDKKRYSGYDAELVQEPKKPGELGLAAHLNGIINRIETQSPSRNEKPLDYQITLHILSDLHTPLNNFFDAVLVNCDNPDIRANRLGLLSAVRDLLDTYVDFEKLEG